MILRRQLGATTLNRQQFGSYDLASGESIAFQFTLPAGTSKLLLDGLYVNIDGRLRGVPGTPPVLGEVSLYNWQRAEWEDRIVGFGRNLVRDVAPYVSATGDIRVRYTFKPPPDTSCHRRQLHPLRRDGVRADALSRRQAARESLRGVDRARASDD